jgi:ABC-2 type transport system ATP-binding protein
VRKGHPFFLHGYNDSMQVPAIELRDVCKNYGNFPAVKHLNLSISRGEIFGFVGPNGAGKTTTIRMITGLAYPTSGSLSIHGMAYATHDLSIKKNIGYIPDRPYLYEKLTGREYLEFVRGVFSVNGSGASIDDYLAMFDLENWSDELVESYSHGMKQRLAFAGALLHDPQILIVDEPMVGLDPKGIRLIKNLFRDLAAKNVSVFVSTHNLELAEQVCHKVGIIHEGNLLACDNIDGLRAKAVLPESGLEDIFLRLTTEEIR